MKMTLPPAFVFAVMVAVGFTRAVIASEIDSQNGNQRSGIAELNESTYFFALLVGSNLPGDNQAPLRYAHRDMAQVRNVLVEIGKHAPEHIQQLADPGSDSLQAALLNVKKQMTRLPASTQSRFVFYYSGHAKSDALTLGNEDMPLGVLRRLLEDIPASQKIIILDACQSGSFSRIKGVQLAEDFSHNSRASLQTRGTAVLASSSATELSQESDSLEGSVFTHNLVSGLRGAADSDANGRVSLFEAYDYAYNNTLVATADTRVGKQHVTLETDLKGTGETTLSWPEASSAKLILPKDVKGTVVVFEERTKTIHAEIHKAEGSDITLAFAPGKYGVMVTGRNRALHCSIQLKSNTVTKLKKDSCQTARLKSGAAKHDNTNTRGNREYFRWSPFVTAQVGMQFLRRDNFIRTLEHLGYRTSAFNTNHRGELVPYFEVLAGLSVNRCFSFGLLYSSLNRFTFRADHGYNNFSQIVDRRTFEWSGYRINAQLRFQYPFLKDRLIPHVFVETGPGVVKHQYKMQQINNVSYYAHPITIEGGELRQKGWVVGGGVGINVRLYRQLCVAAQWKYLLAPILSNIYSEKQNAGGWIATAGLRIGL
ncbi:MAG: caspase family protein [Deltaproteobacteria bacterium]|nr:caspase family protein [Deltaproteobacteria bacterium]